VAHGGVVLRHKKLYLAGFLLHFFFVTAISSRELFWVLGRGLTIAPPALKDHWRKAEDVSSLLLGQGLPPANVLRRATTAYLNLAGIEAGYGFFAPNVSNSSKLVFELHYADGRVEYEVPSVSSDASGLRVATLLDKIGRPQYAPLREVIIKMLTRSVWQEHPDVEVIRAVFGSVVLPNVAEFERGVRESNEFLFAYDFDFRTSENNKPNP
jgi:hypothetical protein